MNKDYKITITVENLTDKRVAGSQIAGGLPEFKKGNELIFSSTGNPDEIVIKIMCNALAAFAKAEIGNEKYLIRFKELYNRYKNLYE